MNALLFAVLLGGIPGCESCTTSVSETEALEARVSCQVTVGHSHSTVVAHAPALVYRPLFRRPLYHFQHRRFAPLRRLWLARPGLVFRR
jgi:hypothetical protein